MNCLYRVPVWLSNHGVSSTSSDTDITVNDYGICVVRVPACNDAICRGAAALQFAVEPAPELAPTPTPAPKRPAQPLPLIAFVASNVVKTSRISRRFFRDRATPYYSKPFLLNPNPPKG